MSSCTTRPSTWAAPRTTCRSATSPRWSATRCPAPRCRWPRRRPGPAQLPRRLLQADRTFPELRLRWTVREGVDELAAAYAKYGLTYDDFMSSRFVRLRRIRELLAAGSSTRCCAGRTASCRRAPTSGRRHADASGTSRWAEGACV